MRESARSVLTATYSVYGLSCLSHPTPGWGGGTRGWGTPWEKNVGPETEVPLERTWDQRLERDIGPDTGVPLWADRKTDTCGSF